MIKVTHLNKAFGSTQAVNDLSFEIQTGEIVGFLGPNGAGKTTTMRLLTGFLSPDRGEISINHQPLVDNLHQAQAQIGYLPENNPLYPDMLVSETLELAADLKHIPPSARKESFDFVVNSVGIDEVFYRPIIELSKGYRQRVGMAIALLHRPNILIMDEPTEGLDPNQRSEIRSLIKNLAQDRTIILSTHVMQEALAVANRILILNHGQLVADGSPESLMQTSGDETRYEITLQGKAITSTIKQISQLTNFHSTKISTQKYRITATSPRQFELQPHLSRLAAKHHWTIWKLSEQESSLEDVFHQLTQSGS